MESDEKRLAIIFRRSLCNHIVVPFFFDLPSIHCKLVEFDTQQYFSRIELF